MIGNKLNELSGEKIEQLLWKIGCDSNVVEIDEDTWELHIGFGDYTVVLGELYFDEPGKWMVDPLTVTIDLIFQEEVVAADADVYSDEQDLVEGIARLAGDQ